MYFLPSCETLFKECQRDQKEVEAHLQQTRRPTLSNGLFHHERKFEIIRVDEEANREWMKDRMVSDIKHFLVVVYFMGSPSGR
jgi:hypothetical protein